jgi:hypothetical protein
VAKALRVDVTPGRKTAKRKRSPEDDGADDASAGKGDASAATLVRDQSVMTTASNRDVPTSDNEAQGSGGRSSSRLVAARNKKAQDAATPRATP